MYRPCAHDDNFLLHAKLSIRTRLLHIRGKESQIFLGTNSEAMQVPSTTESATETIRSVFALRFAQATTDKPLITYIKVSIRTCPA